jgi:hypothetical protein
MDPSMQDVEELLNISLGRETLPYARSSVLTNNNLKLLTRLFIESRAYQYITHNIGRLLEKTDRGYNELWSGCSLGIDSISYGSEHTIRSNFELMHLNLSFVNNPEQDNDLIIKRASEAVTILWVKEIPEIQRMLGLGDDDLRFVQPTSRDEELNKKLIETIKKLM